MRVTERARARGVLLLSFLAVVDPRLLAEALSLSQQPTPDLRHVVVVGGGVGGLAAAARIARPGIQVTLLEKNDYVGGRCGSFTTTHPQGTFRHERGPSLLLLPQVYRDLFRDCGTTAEEIGLEMAPCIPAYQVVFDDGDAIEVGFPRKPGEGMTEEELASRRKMNSFEPDGAAKWDDYMRACEAFLDCGLPNFIEERLDLASFPRFLYEALRDGARAWPLKPHSDVLDAMFDSTKMRALASFQDLYVGLEPYRNDERIGGGILETTAPAVFGLLAAIEVHPTNDKCGVFAPIGGFGAVTASLERLAVDRGVKLVTRRTVTQVTEEGVYHQGSLSRDEQFLPADLVLVNADLPYASRVLLSTDNPKDRQPRYDWTDKEQGRLLEYRFSSGVIAFHWSVDKELSDLGTHNVFLAAGSRMDAEESWDVLRTSTTPLPSTRFNFYVHRASKTDRTAAPKVKYVV